VNDIGQRIASLRKSRGLTQRQLADRIGVAQSTIASWETGKREPNREYIVKLATFFNTTTDYILCKENELSIEDNIKSSQINAREERDIARELERIMESLDSDSALAFDGEPLDEQDKELLRVSLENSIRLARQLAKQKFTPKKYKKD